MKNDFSSFSESDLEIFVKDLLHFQYCVDMGIEKSRVDEQVVSIFEEKMAFFLPYFQRNGKTRKDLLVAVLQTKVSFFSREDYRRLHGFDKILSRTVPWDHADFNDSPL